MVWCECDSVVCKCEVGRSGLRPSGRQGAMKSEPSMKDGMLCTKTKAHRRKVTATGRGHKSYFLQARHRTTGLPDHNEPITLKNGLWRTRESSTMRSAKTPFGKSMPQYPRLNAILL